MSFKRRIGNFLILFGLVAFVVFAASLLATPKAGFDIPSFLAAAVLLTVGVNFRLSKSGDGPLVTRASSPPAAKAGPPSGGKPAGGKPGGGGKGGPAKKQSVANKIMKGPADKRLPPKPGPGGGGKPPAGKKK